MVPRRDSLCCQNETEPCEEVGVAFETDAAIVEVAEAASHAAVEAVVAGGDKGIAAAAVVVVVVVVVEVVCEPLDGSREGTDESLPHVHHWGPSTWTSSSKTTTTIVARPLAPLTLMPVVGSAVAAAVVVAGRS